MKLQDATKLVAMFAVFTLGIFLALELTLRVYMFGWVGLSPNRVNSCVNIFRSGLVQPADNLEGWFELKPDQNTLFRGAPFRTNSVALSALH